MDSLLKDGKLFVVDHELLAVRAMRAMQRGGVSPFPSRCFFFDIVLRKPQCILSKVYCQIRRYQHRCMERENAMFVLLETVFESTSAFCLLPSGHLGMRKTLEQLNKFRNK